MIRNKVKIENLEFNYNINDNIVLLDNDENKIEVLKRFSDDYYEIEINGRKVIVGLRKDNNQIQLNYQNRWFDIDIIDSFSAIKKEMTRLSGNGSKTNIIRAPMPGLVVKINKNINDKVEKGETILIIEAMKMENAIKSPVDGIITSIKLKIGNSVAKNDVLFEIENIE